MRRRTGAKSCREWEAGENDTSTMCFRNGRDRDEKERNTNRVASFLTTERRQLVPRNNPICLRSVHDSDVSYQTKNEVKDRTHLALECLLKSHECLC